MTDVAGIKNRTFDEMQVGDKASLVSAVLGTRLPGPGTIYLEQDLKFPKPVTRGDTITATVIVREKRPNKHIVLLDTLCTNQHGDRVLSGTATVIAPGNTIEWPRTTPPDVSIRRHDRYDAFIRAARSRPPISAAIVHPCSPEAILGAIEARDEGLLEPLLIGPEAKIRAAAEAANVSLDSMTIESVEHSHAEHKRDICQNAIDVMHRLAMEKPLVAVLAAVETVNSKMPSTLDAAALAVMAARGQIAGAKVDGPLAFDNAISPDAARTKGIASPVAGQADILLVPDLEAGNMLSKQLIYFAGATAAGLVLGARVPIVLTSRSDSLTARIASAALAKLVAAPHPVKNLPS